MQTERAAPSGAPPGIQLFDPPRAVDVPVWVAALLLVGSGWLYAVLSAPEPWDVRVFDGAVTLRVGAGFSVAEGDDLWLASLHDLSDYPPRLWVQRLPDQISHPSELEAVADRVGTVTDSTGAGYRVLRREAREAFGGHRALWSWYAIVRDPPGTLSEDATLPVVLEGVNVVTLADDGQVYQVSAEALPEQLEPPKSPLRRMLASVRIHSVARDRSEPSSPGQVGATAASTETSAGSQEDAPGVGRRAASRDGAGRVAKIAEDAGTASRPVAEQIHRRRGSPPRPPPSVTSPNPYLVLSPQGSDARARSKVSAEGTVADALTGTPVAARVLVGRPGTDLEPVVYGFLDGTLSSTALGGHLVATARADARGEYQVHGLTRGRHHPASAVARGYPPVFFSIRPSANAPEVIRVPPVYVRR